MRKTRQTPFLPSRTESLKTPDPENFQHTLTWRLGMTPVNSAPHLRVTDAHGWSANGRPRGGLAPPPLWE